MRRLTILPTSAHAWRAAITTPSNRAAKPTLHEWHGRPTRESPNHGRALPHSNPELELRIFRRVAARLLHRILAGVRRHLRLDRRGDVELRDVGEFEGVDDHVREFLG